MGEMIEYIWDKPKSSGAHRQRKGVMVAFVEPGSDTVSVGVSLCCGLDRFDYKDGQKCKGFGVAIATERAKKHVNTEWVKIHGVTSIPQELRDKGDAEGVWIKEMKLPASSVEALINFSGRCQRYFKDKKLPTWLALLENEEMMMPVREQIKINQVLENDYFSTIGCELCCDPSCDGCDDY